jgi:hypothetical protein
MLATLLAAGRVSGTAIGIAKIVNVGSTSSRYPYQETV